MLPANLSSHQEGRRLLKSTSSVEGRCGNRWWNCRGTMHKTQLAAVCVQSSADGNERDDLANNNCLHHEAYLRTAPGSSGDEACFVPSLNGADDLMVDGDEDTDRNSVLGQQTERQTAHHRLVEKSGVSNVVSRSVTGRRGRYLVDFFTTLIEMRWRYHILGFLVSFVACWLLFAVVYLAIVYVHGDLDARAQTDVDWVPCIHNVFDFTSAILYSFETQTTIGYGSRVIDPVCRFGVFVAMLQIYIGTLINMLVTGIVFTKISRPKSRRQTVVFSRVAVVCRRDADYQLLFRVGDMRVRSHFVGTSIRALLVRSRQSQTPDGDLVPLCQYPLSLETETGNNDSYMLLVWPVTVAHRIDANSPLWDVSAKRLQSTWQHFEIIVILEGTIESTGATIQVLTSYIPAEIRWGERLEPLMTCNQADGRYCIDFSRFHDTVPVHSMPTCSAKKWQSRRRQQVGRRQHSIADDDSEDDDHKASFRSPPQSPSAALSSFPAPAAAARAPLSRSLSVPARLAASFTSTLAARKKPSSKTGPAAQQCVSSEEIDLELRPVPPRAAGRRLDVEPLSVVTHPPPTGTAHSPVSPDSETTDHDSDVLSPAVVSSKWSSMPRKQTDSMVRFQLDNVLEADQLSSLDDSSLA